MSDSETLDVIAVGAHPDDIEIACGATLAKLAMQGYKVGIIDLTDGEPTPLSPSPEVRREEAMAAAKALGVSRKILDLPNRRLFDSFEARVALAIEFRKLKPKVVIGFGHKTPMASPDHWQAMQITDAAIFYSRLTKWDDKFDGTPPHTISRQLYFPLNFDLMQDVGLSNRFIVDVSDTFEKKLESISCYKTQFPPTKGAILEKVKALGISVGVPCGYGYGEALFNTRAIGTDDVMNFLF